MIFRFVWEKWVSPRIESMRRESERFLTELREELGREPTREDLRAAFVRGWGRSP